MKRIYQLKGCILCMVAMILLNVDVSFAQYTVQVAAYKDIVPNSHFSARGVNNVRMERKPNYMKYYHGNFSDIGSAESALSDVLSKGFQYARIINLLEARANCPASCAQPAPPPPVVNKPAPPPPIVVIPPPPPPPEPAPLPARLQHIFFDFDRSDLRPESINRLDELCEYLRAHPDCILEVHAHTDSKGSKEYNEALARRRANSAVSYLTRKGCVSPSNIAELTFGEDSPIAKNQVGGGDAPDGRQLNRRVEFRVKCNGQYVDVVEEIYVPQHLKGHNDSKLFRR